MRKLRLLQNFGLLPEVQIVRKHDQVVLTILTRQHDVFSSNLSWEQGHAFALCLFSIQGTDLEREEIAGLHELWQNCMTVVCGIGGVVDHRTVVVDETHKTGILDPLALGFRHGKDHPFGNRVILAKQYLVIGLCQPHCHVNGIRLLL